MIKAKPAKLSGPSVVGKVTLDEPKKTTKKAEEKPKPKEEKVEPQEKSEKQDKKLVETSKETRSSRSRGA